MTPVEDPEAVPDPAQDVWSYKICDIMPALCHGTKQHKCIFLPPFDSPVRKCTDSFRTCIHVVHAHAAHKRTLLARWQQQLYIARQPNPVQHA